MNNEHGFSRDVSLGCHTDWLIINLVLTAVAKRGQKVPFVLSIMSTLLPQTVLHTIKCCFGCCHLS